MFVVPLVAGLAVAAHAATPPNMSLDHMNVGDVYPVVKDIPGLQDVTLHLRDNSITLSGTDEAIAEAKSRLALVDVPPVQFSISGTLTRCEQTADGRITNKVVGKPLFSALSGQTDSVGADDSVSVTPVLNRDGTVTVTAEMSGASPVAARPAVIQIVRLRPDTPTRMLGVTDAKDPLLRHAVEAGEMVIDRGPYAATYLDITVHRVGPDVVK